MQTQNRQTVNLGIIIFPLLLLLLLLMNGAREILSDLEIPPHTGPEPGPSWELETVYTPGFSPSSLSPATSSHVVGTSGAGGAVSNSHEGSGLGLGTNPAMPPLPDCSELGLECDSWEARVDDGQIDVQLKAGDRVVGQTQLMRVKTSWFDELSFLGRMGIDEAWIGHIQVARAMQGNGLGRLMWSAGDAALRLASGSGAVRVISDAAGWGTRLMAGVPKEWFILQEPPLWVYVIP